MSEPKYYRTVVTYEVLSVGPYYFENLEQLAYDTLFGDCSGVTLNVEYEEVSEEQMSELLVAQGSDPSFLLGEDFE